MAFHDLGKRVAFYSIIIAVLAVVVFTSTIPLFRFFIYLLAAVLAGIGVYEYAQMLKIKEYRPHTVVMVVTAMLINLSFIVTFYLDVRAYAVVHILILLTAVLLFVLEFNRIKGSWSNIAMQLFGVMYIAVPIAMMMLLLYEQDQGKIWLVYVIAVTKIVDVAAYFFGKKFGKKRIAPVLSPNKTVVGGVAGLVAAIVLSLAFSMSREFDLAWSLALFYGVVIGVFSQLGDLSESLLKRDAGVKDSNQIPGVGGVLDMLDSLLFTAPTLYILTNLF